MDTQGNEVPAVSGELRNRIAKAILQADDVWHARPFTHPQTEEGWSMHIADAILPVVEAVWEEGRASAFTDMMRPLRDDMTRESTPNPYREED